MSIVAELAVIRFQDRWTLLGRSGRWGRFASSDQAEQAGRRIQAREMAAGRNCVLLVQDVQGQLRPADQ